MEERVTSERYVSLVTQWGTKLSEAIKKLRHQEELISSLKREKFILSEKLSASEATVRKFDDEKAAILVRHQEEEEKLRNDHQKQISCLQNQLTQLQHEKLDLQEKLIHFQGKASNNNEEMNLFQAQKLEDEKKLKTHYKKKVALLQMQVKRANTKSSSSELEELSSLQAKVGVLNKKVVSLETELVKTKKGKIDAEAELIQRMKSEMDKLDKKFASLDDQSFDEMEIEQPPILEIELEAMQETSGHASTSTSGEQMVEDDQDIVEIESVSTSDENESIHLESSCSASASGTQMIHEPEPSTSKDFVFDTTPIPSDSDEDDDDISFICEMPEKTSRQKQNSLVDGDSGFTSSTTGHQVGDNHAEDTFNVGDSHAEDISKVGDSHAEDISKVGDNHAEDTSKVGGLYPQCTCGKQFTTKSSLVTHLRYHQERRFLCKVCKKKFHRFSVWRNHMRVKHKEKPTENFGCSNCGVGFSTKAQFLQHRKLFHSRKT
ncbi:unnamed protein product [Orchesella dallaii]|uniref:C2H2-type domain-containing protein n=1 Tax=Orchesella dallaii TaxID=48710 RepID=A0ABP1QAS5_9HEXA